MYLMGGVQIPLTGRGNLQEDVCPTPFEQWSRQVFALTGHYQCHAAGALRSNDAPGATISVATCFHF